MGIAGGVHRGRQETCACTVGRYPVGARIARPGDGAAARRMCLPLTGGNCGLRGRTAHKRRGNRMVLPPLANHLPLLQDALRA